MVTRSIARSTCAPRSGQFRPPARPEALPDTYGETRIVALEVQPRRLHVWWDLAGTDLERPGRMILRVHDVFQIVFDGTNANSSFDVAVGPGDRSWYVETPSPGRAWVVDLVRQEDGGTERRLGRSGAVQMPREAESATGRPEWMHVDSDPRRRRRIERGRVFAERPEDLIARVAREDVVAFYRRLVGGSVAP